MRIIFIRHGDPDYEKDSLTEKGWREAALLAERVSRWKVTDFYVSPLGRAQDTASLSLKKMGRQARTLPWLREFRAFINDPGRGEHVIPWDFYPGFWTKEERMYDRNAFADTPVMRSGPVKEEYARVCAGLDGLLAHYGYVREGGIFAGLWELAASAGTGIDIALKNIPIRQHTIEVCEFFRLNPYMLRSGGTLLMVSANGERAAAALCEAGIPAAVIGRTTGNNDKIIRYDDEVRYLEPPKEDELLQYYKCINGGDYA